MFYNSFLFASKNQILSNATSRGGIVRLNVSYTCSGLQFSATWGGEKSEGIDIPRETKESGKSKAKTRGQLDQCAATSTIEQPFSFIDTFMTL